MNFGCVVRMEQHGRMAKAASHHNVSFDAAPGD